MLQEGYQRLYMHTDVKMMQAVVNLKKIKNNLKKELVRAI